MKTYFKEPIYVTRPLLPPIEKVEERMRNIWQSQWVTNGGAQLNELEKKLKEYLEIENLVIYSNGTLALIIGLKALGLTGEVITTPFTFPATTEALDWNGLTPVFCDIEEETLNIDANKIEALITDKTSAILAVHVFGTPCNVDKISEIAKKHNLKVIYDAAHAFGTWLKGRPISNYGDMSVFSFHATKLFHSLEGGALAFNDSSYENPLKLLKNFGISDEDEVVLSGFNAKMNELQAAVGIETLAIVNEERAKRKALKKAYKAGLSKIKGIRIINFLEDDESSYQYFVIEVNEEKYGLSRDQLHELLKTYNLFTRKYFYPLCSSFAWYSDLKSAKPENLVQANKSVKEVLTLPFYGGLSIENVQKICEIIASLQK